MKDGNGSFFIAFYYIILQSEGKVYVEVFFEKNAADGTGFCAEPDTTDARMDCGH